MRRRMLGYLFEFYSMAYIIPRLDMTSALSVWLTALISDSAVEVDTLPWSVEHQQIADSPRYPIYEVFEWPLSWLPQKSASRWNFSWRTWVMVFISVGPSCVANFGLSSFAYLQYLRRCLRNSMCLGPGLFLYFYNMLSAEIIVINLCTIPYISCSTTLLYGYFAHSCFWSSVAQSFFDSGRLLSV